MADGLAEFATDPSGKQRPSGLAEFSSPMPEWSRKLLTLLPDLTIGLVQDLGERLSSATGQTLSLISKLTVPEAAQALRAGAALTGDPKLHEAANALGGEIGLSDVTGPARGLFLKEPVAGTPAYASTAGVLRKGGFDQPISEGIGAAAAKVPPDIPGVSGAASLVSQALSKPPEGVPSFAGHGLMGIPIPTPALMPRVAGAVTSPEAAGFALESMGAEGLTAGAKATIVPAGKALGSSRLGEAARQLPVVRAVGRAFSRGFDIPQSLPEVAGPARQGLRDILSQTSNDAAATEYALNNIVKGFSEKVHDAAQARGVDPEELMRLVRDAAEELPRQGEAALKTLTPEEAQLALAVREVSDTIPKWRSEAGLEEASLGAGARAAAAGVRTAVGEAQKATAAEASLRGLSAPELPGATIPGPTGVLPESPVVRGTAPTGIAVQSELAGPTLAAREELANLHQDLRAVTENAASNPDAPPLRPSEMKSIIGKRTAELDAQLAALAEQVRHRELPAITQTGISPEGTFVGAEPVAQGVSTPPAGALEAARRQTKGALSAAYGAARNLEAQGIPLPRVAGAKGSFFGADLSPTGGVPMIGRRIDLEEAARIAGNIDRYLVGHTPWVRTAESRIASGLKRFGGEPVPTAAGARGVSTKFGKPRTTAPTKTLSQLEAEIDSNPFETLDRALPAHIRTNAVAMAHARALQQVSDFAGVRLSATDAARYGAHIPETEALPGYRSLGSIPGAKTGLKPEIGAMLDRTYVHPAVYSAMEDYAKVLSPQNYGQAQRVAKAMMRGFKLLYTLPNPQFVERNQEWNLAVSVFRGNRNPRTAAIAARALGQSSIDAPFKIGTFSSTDARLLDEYIRNGVMSDLDLVRGEFGAVGKAAEPTSALAKVAGAPGALWKKYIGAAGKLNWTGETLGRTTHYVWARSVGMTEKEAALEVVHSYFNYARDAYTAFENWGRDFVPWLSWVRRIIPLTLRTAFERPGEFARLGAGVNEWNAMQGVSPEEMVYLGPWYLQSLGIVLPPAEATPAYPGHKAEPGQPPGTRRMANLGFIGFLDPIQRFFPQVSDYAGMTSPTDRARSLGMMLLSQGRPEVSAGLQEITSRNFFTGGELSGRYVRLPLFAAHLPAPVQTALGIEVHDGVPIGTDRLKIALGVVGPLGSGPLGFLSDSPQDQAKGIAWATSVRIDPAVNEALGKQFAFGKAKAGAVEQRKIIRGKAQLVGRIHQEQQPQQQGLGEFAH